MQSRKHLGVQKCRSGKYVERESVGIEATSVEERKVLIYECHLGGVL